jgi:hypothetical protein
MPHFAKQDMKITTVCDNKPFSTTFYVDLKSAIHFVTLQHFKNPENIKMHFLLAGYTH